MTTLTQSAYAKRRGVSKQRISVLKGEGRIVMDDRGRVCVEETDALLDATESGLPQHQARKAADRQQKAATDDVTSLTESSKRLKQFQARKAEADAAIAEMERDRMAGTLVPVDEVERTLADVFSLLRLTMESLPDKFAAQLGAETDEARIHALMSEEITAALHHAADRLEHEAKKRGAKKWD